MEPTVVIALITALAAIASPVITAVINNRNIYMMKQIEVKEMRLQSISLHEREILEQALSGIGVLMSWQDLEGVKEACKSILTAVAYVDSETRERLRRVVKNVSDQKDVSLDEYAEVCEALKTEISKRTSN